MKHKDEFEFKDGELLLFDKPLTWTSFDVVGKVRNRIRRHIGEKCKVGHAGTLDPLATGLLILCSGKFTKKLEGLTVEEKEYTGTICFGKTTPSYDAESEPNATFDTTHLTQEMIEAVLPQFRGEIEQFPPIFSALKVNGKKLYDYARKGEEVEIKSRRITIKEIELTNFNLPTVDFRVVCSKGTYIRSLAHDIGKSVGNGAYLTALRRTKIGDFDVKDAYQVNDFCAMFEEV